MNRKSGDRAVAAGKGKENSAAAPASSSQIRRRLSPRDGSASQDNTSQQEAPPALADRSTNPADEEW